MRIDNDGVFLRAYGYSFWFPIFLEAGSDSYSPDFKNVSIHLPAEYIPVFAGERISERVQDGSRISRWSAPGLDLFAAQCTARKFTVSSEGELLLYHFSDSASTSAARDILAFARHLTDDFSGKYRRGAASGQMHIMEMPRYGETSSGNVTGITGETWRNFSGERRYKRYLAHEMVHPFVQTKTRMDDPFYALQIEGFPSYFHLPILAETLGREWYDSLLTGVEHSYLEKRKSGKGRRGRLLPPEIPITEITADEVGTYKDEFVLDDRALLFLNWIYTRLGKAGFFEFTEVLFNQDQMTYASFNKLLLEYLPNSEEDIEIWLNTTEFPQRFYIKN